MLIKSTKSHELLVADGNTEQKEMYSNHIACISANFSKSLVKVIPLMNSLFTFLFICSKSVGNSSKCTPSKSYLFKYSHSLFINIGVSVFLNKARIASIKWDVIFAFGLFHI